MKPTSNKALPCAVFGHNYVKSKTHTDHTAELTCKHCGETSVTDKSGNFVTESITNTEIQSTLRRLFHLKRQISKPTFS